MLSSKTKRELKIDQRQILIDSIEIGIPSPQQILTWGERVLPNGQKVGLVKNSKTVNYKRFTPFRDGLFCERIFGPVTSFVCACGKKQPHSKVTFCEKCEVEYIDQRSRRYRLGYISLLSPVTHIWYLKGRPSYLSLFLGKRKKTVIALAYCNAYLIEHGISKRDSNPKIDPIWPSIPFPRSGTGVARRRAVPLPCPSTPRKGTGEGASRGTPIFDWQRGKKGQVGEPTGFAYKSSICTARLAKRMQFQNPKRRFFQQTLELASSPRIALSQEQRQIGTAMRRLARKGNTRRRTTRFSEQTYGSYLYARQHTLPFLPTFISHFYLRDALLHFLYSRPAYDDIPLEEYCCRKRREPLRDVHKFMAQKTVENSCFHSTQLSKKDLCKNKGVFKRLRSYKSYKTRADFFTNRTGFRLQNVTSCCVSRHPQLNVRLFDLEGQFFNGKADWQSELAPPITPSSLGDFAGPYGERGGVSNLCRARSSNCPFYRPVRSRLPCSYWHTNLLTLLTNRKFALPAFTEHRSSKAIVGQAEERQLQFKGSKRICKADWKTRAANAHFFYLASQNKIEPQNSKQSFSLSPAPRGSRPPLPIEDSHVQEGVSREVQPLCSALPCPFAVPCAPIGQRARRLTRVRRFVHQCPIPLGGKGKKIGKEVRTAKAKEFVRHAVRRICHQGNRRVACTERREKKIWGRRCSLLLKQPKKEEERVEKEQKGFARFKAKGQARRGASLSGLELGAIREILSYTGGGALQQILQQFDQHDLCKFLFAEAQILRLLYETHIIDFQNGFIDKSIPSICTPVSTKNKAGVTARLAIGTTTIKTMQRNSFKKDRDEQNLGRFLPELSLAPKGFAKAKLTSNGFAKAKLTLTSKEVSFTSVKPKGVRVTEADKGGRHARGKKNKKRIYLTADELQNKINDSRKKRIVRISRRIYKIARRLKVTQLLTRNHRRPEWMILSHLPVLPPDLRPILQMSEKVIVASDLNIMYQRVVYRNNRHLRVRFIDFHLVTAIQRLVQDAVDRLIENGKGGSKPYYTQGGRPLKSLSDILKGKKGRFRLNLLGKRVDFSGRSVIVVSPSCKIHECGLPKDIALELYHYFLLRQLIVKKQCASIVTAKKMIKSKSSLMWDILRELMYHHPVLLNRAPTLHRLGIQAFQPKLVLGNAILLHPLVCSGFNADFDGDQMGVHLPLSFAARSESWDLLWSRNNLLSPATGQPMLVPSQDMVLGFYYITAQSLKGFNSTKRLLVPSFPYRSPSPIPVFAPARPSALTYLEGARRGACLPSKPFRSSFLLKNEASNFCKAKSCSLRCTHNGKSSTKVTKTEETFLFLSTEEITTAFQNGNIKLHTPIWLYWNAKVENEEVSQIPLELRIHGFGAQQLVYERQIYSNFFTKNRNDNRDKDISNLGNESYRHFYASTILKPSYLICTSPKAYYIRTTPGRILMNSLLEI